MDIKDYQGIIAKTAMYPKEIGLAYCALGLAGEAGEVADKVKKLYRDQNFLNSKVLTVDERHSLIKELGDIQWYITAMAVELDSSLEEIMTINYDKLIKRRETGTLSGSGDDRETK